MNTPVLSHRRARAWARARFLVFSLILLVCPAQVRSQTDARPPNFIIIFADDLGYGDLSCYGHPTIRTPALDRMASEGTRFTDFYSAAPVCTPSRAALLTGRLPVRSGMCSEARRVLFPDSAEGLPAEEVTLAEALKPAGYATACIGKWHLGHRAPHLPTRNGFDYYYGIPYSNDMDRVASSPRGRQAFLEPSIEYWNVPLMRNEEVVERPADQRTITRRYTEEALKFIETNRDRPFFLYLAHSFPHVPLFASEAFAGKSARGSYGDVVEELDWSVGKILDALRESGLAEETLVIFTSDNGPWLAYNEQGGSAGLLREGKGSTWEGGMRVPGIAWWPEHVPAGRVNSEVISTMDLFPTLLGLAKVALPEGRELDGLDIAQVLMGTGSTGERLLFYYRDTEPFAVRKGVFKAHFLTQPGYGARGPERHEAPLLFHLGHDPSERFDVAEKYPEQARELTEAFRRHADTIERGRDRLSARIAQSQ